MPERDQNHLVNTAFLDTVSEQPKLLHFRQLHFLTLAWMHFIFSLLQKQVPQDIPHLSTQLELPTPAQNSPGQEPRLEAEKHKLTFQKSFITFSFSMLELAACWNGSQMVNRIKRYFLEL